MTEDERVGWHHRLDGHGFGQALGVSDGQGSLACCSPWGQTQLSELIEIQKKKKEKLCTAESNTTL